MPFDKLTLQTISAHTGRLTEMAAQPDFEAIPFSPFADNEFIPGLAVSVAEFLSFLKKHPDTQFDVVNATAFHQNTYSAASSKKGDAWWQGEADFKVVTFATRLDKAPACFVVVSPGMHQDFAKAISMEETLDYRLPCSLPPDFLSYESTAPAGIVVRDGHKFNNDIPYIAELVADGRIVWQRDFQVAALPCDTALHLKASLHNGCSDIIQDVSVREFWNAPKLCRDRVNDEGIFARLVHPPSNRRKSKEAMYTLVPWYTANQLITDEDGHIESVPAAPRKISHSFTTFALVQTDYTNVLKVTLAPPQDRTRGRRPRLTLPADQQRVLERALDPKTGTGINVQGHFFASAGRADAEEYRPTTRLFPSVFDAHSDFCANVGHDGNVHDAHLTLGGAQHLEALAAGNVKNLVIHAAGQDFVFERTL